MAKRKRSRYEGPMRDRVGLVGVVWGIGGVIALLLFAVARLTPVALDAIRGNPEPLTLAHWLAVVFSIVFFAYTEGYRAFQLNFSPRVVARGLSLLRSTDVVRLVFAPAFCMGYFGATRRRLIASWALTGAVVVLVALVRSLPQPWRGIIDLGVAIALLWGAVAIVAFAARAAAGEVPGIATDIPESRPVRV